MMNAFLYDTVALSFGTSQNFRIDKSAGAVHLDIIKNFPPEQLKRTVNITNIHSEQKTHQRCPAKGIDFSYKTVLPVYPVTAHNIAVAYQRQNSRQLTYVKLPVAVCIKNKIFRRRAKTALKRSSIAGVFFMMNDSYTFIF